MPKRAKKQKFIGPQNNPALKKKNKKNKGKSVVFRGKMIHGKGDYEVDPDVANIVGMAGQGIGSLLGSGDLGRAAALSAHRLFKRITGVGDYTVRQNTILNGAVPRFMKEGRATIIAHTESLGFVYSKGTYGFQKYRINPGDPRTFPWLSKIAGNFQQYRFKGLAFIMENQALSATSGTNVASGTNCSMTNYNVYDPDPKSIQQMLNNMYSKETKPQEDNLHPIECDRAESQVQLLNVAIAGSIPASADARLYYVGTYYLAGEGYQSTDNKVGRLHVAYEIELYKTKEDISTVYIDHYQLGTDVASATPFGSAPKLTTYSVNKATLLTNTITIDPYYEGGLKVSYTMFGTGGTTICPTMAASGNATLAAGLLSDTTDTYSATNSAGAVFTEGYFDCTGGGVITFSASTVPTGQQGGDLVITYLGVTEV